MDLTVEANIDGGGRVTIDITADNFLELPSDFHRLFHHASTCSETLSLLSYAAIILDAKQAEFKAGLREATAVKTFAVAFGENREAMRKADRCPSRACRDGRRCIRGPLNPALCLSTPVNTPVCPLHTCAIARRCQSNSRPRCGSRPMTAAELEHAKETAGLSQPVEGDDNAFAGETAPDRRQGERRGKIGNRRGLGQPGPPLGHAERRTRLYGRREGNDRRVPPVGNQ